ncbi:hypothetical protein ACFSUS_13005 [Spirosoma soli]|uniref:Uncharacterized protein n=1 Tax=Spirosoma soli TaxID=1770529 RepID=A0ABW5M5E8_9BACT
MVSLHEQVVVLQRQIDSLTQQVSVLVNRINAESLTDKQGNTDKQDIGINRYRQLQGKA